MEWLELSPKEAYEYRINHSMSVFLFREGKNRWLAWYARWVDGKPEPVKSKDLTPRPCHPKTARKKAEDFIQWFEQNNKGGE